MTATALLLNNDPRNNDAKSAPYDPATLHVPLTATQRGRIIQWEVLQKFNGVSGIPSNLNVPDKQLIEIYTTTVYLLSTQGSPITGPPNPISGITDFLNRLWSAITSAQFWIRAGEVVGGLLVLGLGLDAMLKSKPQVIANVNVQKALKAVK